MEERLSKNVAQVSELEARLHGVQRQLHEVEGDRKSLEVRQPSSSDCRRTLFELDSVLYFEVKVFFFGGADRCACRCCAIWAHAVKPKAQVRHHEERYRTARASLSRAEESVAVLSTELASARDHISQLELKEASQATALSGLERDFSTAQAQRKALENEKAHLVQEHAAKLDEYARTEQSLREQLDDQAEVLRGVRQAADVRTRDAEDRYKKQLDVV